MSVATAARLAPIAAWMVKPPAYQTTSPVITAYRQHAAARAMCKLHAIDVRTVGSRPEGPALLVSNHLGYFDPVVVGALTPCVSLAKHEVRGWPLVGSRLRELGVLFVDRADRRSGARGRSARSCAPFAWGRAC